MHPRQSLLLFLLAALSPTASAQPGQRFVCEPLSGHAYLHRGTDARDWSLEPDGLSLYTPQLIVSGDDARLELIASEKARAMGASANTTALHTLAVTKTEATFVGLENGAPIMITFYPGRGLLAYSRHRLNVPRGGANVDVFFAKCESK